MTKNKKPQSQKRGEGRNVEVTIRIKNGKVSINAEGTTAEILLTTADAIGAMIANAPNPYHAAELFQIAT